MPSPYQYHIITTLADHDGVLADTGFNADIPLYTASDPTPRTQTHARCASVFTPVQEAAIEDPGGARDTYPNSDFAKYHRVTEKNVPNDRLAALGLTTSQT